MLALIVVGNDSDAEEGDDFYHTSYEYDSSLEMTQKYRELRPPFDPTRAPPMVHHGVQRQRIPFG